MKLFWMQEPLTLVGILTVWLMFGFVCAEAEDWSAWKRRMPIRLAGLDPKTAGLLPVDVDFSLKAEEATDPRKEIRLVCKRDGSWRQVPFQLSRLTLWTKDTAEDGRSVPTINGRITFFPDGEAVDGDYAMLYGNPKTLAPQYETDLRVSGEEPAWTIENGLMRVELSGGPGKHAGSPDFEAGRSGQLAAVTLKSHPDTIFTNQRRILHWNPGIFVPDRGWIHSYAWDPPDRVEIDEGPIFVEVRRSGPFPRIPEARLSVAYRVFSNRSFVESSTRIDIADSIGVVALRNDELVFNENLFTHVAWEDEGELQAGRMADYGTINVHGDFLRVAPDVPFVMFYNPEKEIGAATVRVTDANAGPDGGPPVLFDHATYLAHGEEFHYWFRGLVYFSVSWDRKQLITVPKGSMYSERNLYLFLDGKEGPMGDRVIKLSKAVRSGPDVQVGGLPIPPRR